MKNKELYKRIESVSHRSAWSKGVQEQALEMRVECTVCNPTKLHTGDIALPFRYTHLIGQFIACDYITDRYGNGVLESSNNLEDLVYKYDGNEDVYYYYVGSEGIVYAPIFG